MTTLALASVLKTSKPAKVCRILDPRRSRGNALLPLVPERRCICSVESVVRTCLNGYIGRLYPDLRLTLTPVLVYEVRRFRSCQSDQWDVFDGLVHGNGQLAATEYTELVSLGKLRVRSNLQYGHQR